MFLIRAHESRDRPQCIAVDGAAIGAFCQISPSRREQRNLRKHRRITSNANMLGIERDRLGFIGQARNIVHRGSLATRNDTDERDQDAAFEHDPTRARPSNGAIARHTTTVTTAVTWVELKTKRSRSRCTDLSRRASRKHMEARGTKSKPRAEPAHLSGVEVFRSGENVRAFVTHPGSTIEISCDTGSMRSESG